MGSKETEKGDKFASIGSFVINSNNDTDRNQLLDLTRVCPVFVSRCRRVASPQPALCAGWEEGSEV